MFKKTITYNALLMILLTSLGSQAPPGQGSFVYDEIYEWNRIPIYTKMEAPPDVWLQTFVIPYSDRESIKHKLDQLSANGSPGRARGWQGEGWYRYATTTDPDTGRIHVSDRPKGG